MEFLQVSDNGRFLVTESGEPFFWLGDTAWELFHRLTREEASEYLYERGIVAYPYTTELPVVVLGAKYKWARGAGVM